MAAARAGGLGPVGCGMGSAFCLFLLAVGIPLLIAVAA